MSLINLKRYNEAYTEIPMCFSDKLTATYKGRKYVAKNIITDEGLVHLNNFSLNQLLQYLVIGYKVNAGWEPLVSSISNDFAIPGAQAHMVGDPATLCVVEHNSWVEGWTNFKPTGDVLTTAGDYSTRTLKRTWSIDGDNFDPVNTKAEGTIEDHQDNGGSSDSDKDNIALETIICNGFPPPELPESTTAGGEKDKVNIFGLARVMDRPAGTIEGRFVRLHELTDLWNIAYFKDEFGTPVVFNFNIIDTLVLEYELTLQVPITPVQHIVNGITATSRAYRPQLDNWHILAFGDWTSTTSSYRCHESNVMPAIEDAQVGSSVAADSVVLTPNGAAIDCEMRWYPSSANSFATGIGSVAHGRRSSAATPNSITTFDPKVAKDNTKRFIFQVRYSWDRVSGD